MTSPMPDDTPEHLLMPVTDEGNGPARHAEIADIVCWCGVAGCRKFFDGVHVLILDVDYKSGDLWWHCRCGWFAGHALPSPTAGQKAHDEDIFSARNWKEKRHETE